MAISVEIRTRQTLMKEALGTRLSQEEMITVGKASSPSCSTEEATQPAYVVVGFLSVHDRDSSIYRDSRSDRDSRKLVAVGDNVPYSLVLQGLLRGLNGYVEQRSGIQRLIDAIVSVADGHQFLDPVRNWPVRFTDPETELESVPFLTHREENVVRLLAEGRTNAEIAEMLTISPALVASHIDTILLKCDAEDRETLARKVLAWGFL